MMTPSPSERQRAASTRSVATVFGLSTEELLLSPLHSRRITAEERLVLDVLNRKDRYDEYLDKVFALNPKQQKLADARERALNRLRAATAQPVTAKLPPSEARPRRFRTRAKAQHRERPLTADYCWVDEMPTLLSESLRDSLAAQARTLAALTASKPLRDCLTAQNSSEQGSNAELSIENQNWNSSSEGLMRLISGL